MKLVFILVRVLFSYLFSQVVSAGEGVGIRYSPERSGSSVYVFCDAKKKGVSALVTLRKTEDGRQRVINKSFLKSFVPANGANRIGMEVYFFDRNQDSEWKHTWILDGYGKYEVIFDRSDGMVFTAIFEYIMELELTYIEISDLRSVQNKVPEWALPVA